MHINGSPNHTWNWYWHRSWIYKFHFVSALITIRLLNWYRRCYWPRWKRWWHSISKANCYLREIKHQKWDKEDSRFGFRVCRYVIHVHFRLKIEGKVATIHKSFELNFRGKQKSLRQILLGYSSRARTKSRVIIHFTVLKLSFQPLKFPAFISGWKNSVDPFYRTRIAV